MNRNKKILSMLLAFTLAIAMFFPQALAEDVVPGPVRILFTHDMHASLEPAEFADANGHLTESGGFARLSTAIAEAKAVNPQGTLLVDAGDYTMGTLFQTVETT